MIIYKYEDYLFKNYLLLSLGITLDSWFATWNDDRS